MHSSPEASDNELFPDADNPITPLNQITEPSALSPPDSQGGVSLQQAMPVAEAGHPIANSNGKRPLQSIDGTEMSNGTGVARAPGSAPGRTDRNSGYTWYKPEDEPGYAWMNKKAMDEANRAYDSLVDREKTIGSKFYHSAYKCKACATT